MHKRAASALFAVCSLACSSGTSAPASEAPPRAEPAAEAPAPDRATEVPTRDAPLAAATSAMTVAETTLVQSSLDGLAVDLAPHLIAEGENATFSPASVLVAFAMTTAGAVGTTRDELAHALHLGADSEAAIDAVAHAGRLWGGAHPDYELSVANRLFGEQTYVFVPAYLDRLANRFGAPLQPMDFAGAPDASVTQINDWVAAQTHDRIRDLVPPDGVTASTALVLVNAIYFHGAWQTAFDVARTAPETFTTASGEALLVPTMSRPLGDVTYQERGGAQIVELPYRGDELAMSFVLPPAGTPAERWITASNLALLDGIGTERAEVHIPRFRIEPSQSVSLRSTFEALGVHAAWTDAAGFTGIAATRGQDPIQLSDAYHKAFVEVNEEGTEAAAATAVVAVRGMAMPQAHTIVRFDRPFLFFLRDRATHAILFVGRVGRPR